MPTRKSFISVKRLVQKHKESPCHSHIVMVRNPLPFQCFSVQSFMSCVPIVCTKPFIFFICFPRSLTSGRGCLGVGRLYAANNVPGLLGTRSKKNFSKLKKIFKIFLSKQFFQTNFFFQKNFQFFKKEFFPKKFKNIFLNKNSFSEKTFFLKKFFCFT